MKPAAILLAAGGSTRLGSPKQLLTFQGRTLLRRAAETALAVPCHPVVVVLGAGVDTLRERLAGLEVQWVANPTWEHGMGGSIRRGLEALADSLAEPRTTGPEAVLLTLCDQPLVGAEALRRLVAAFAQNRAADTIAASFYQDTVGVPVLFGRAYFDELRALPADAGAKPLLRRHAAKVIAISMPEAAVDIDTRAQYERLTTADSLL